MSETIYGKFEEIRAFCHTHCSESELWPTYYDRRFQEFLTYFEFFPRERYPKVLELGCGIGYNSAFLSKISDQVVATDLEEENPSSHSPGLRKTRKFLAKLNITNVNVMNASAIDLPFADNSFDMVFSSFVLEHVPNLNKAILEINRVLKPGGHNICIVPTSTDAVYSFFFYYMYLVKRTFVKIGELVYSKSASAGGIEASKAVSSESKSTFFTYFPFPPPHGVLPNYLSELRYWRAENWRKKITAAYSIRLVLQRNLQLNPLLPLSGVFFPGFGTKLYAASRKAENRLSQYSLFKILGISSLLITEKCK